MLHAQRVEPVEIDYRGLRNSAAGEVMPVMPGLGPGYSDEFRFLIEVKAEG
jgi:hypothetical protein